MREQTTIRLTLRSSEEQDQQIRAAAQMLGLNMNQMMLIALNHWARSRRSRFHSP